MKPISTLNAIALFVWFIPTLLLALLGYVAIPLLVIFGAAFPKPATNLMQSIGRWADRKTAEWDAAINRLANKP